MVIGLTIYSKVKLNQFDRRGTVGLYYNGGDYTCPGGPGGVWVPIGNDVESEMETSDTVNPDSPLFLIL